MTTVTFDVSYGTRAVPFRLPYLSVRRRRPAGVLAAVADRREAHRERSAHRARVARAVQAGLTERERATDRALAARAGLL
ncbi:hypothetical protein [Cellulomonas triticagri]|uniref:Uncharacterized protein n=1 Tax=Cellulomonas triticagri TaxID=2483352 RepID=A0A3M2JA66_9CELL|nr:hypothetical protein [Cellulomonas triticagri]RMI08690.1 hypothetical protein EBM89_13460 [Cellulomonas triticagri]